MLDKDNYYDKGFGNYIDFDLNSLKEEKCSFLEMINDLVNKDSLDSNQEELIDLYFYEIKFLDSIIEEREEQEDFLDIERTNLRGTKLVTSDNSDKVLSTLNKEDNTPLADRW